MGSCYYVELKVKLKNKAKAIKALQEKIARGKKENVNYGLESYVKHKNYNLNNFDDLIKIFLCEHQGDFEIEIVENGFTKYSSGFDASYGWESLMIEMFEEIALYLEDRSRIMIDCDDGWDEFVVANGKSYQTH